LILLLDNFDSFTYNLVDYFEQLNVTPRVFRNNQSLEEITNNKYAGVVLSPGPGLPEESGNLLNVIKYYADKLPILGICLGHQAIGLFFNTAIVKANRPMHGKISKVILEDDYLFKNIPVEINAVRYHSLILGNLSDKLEIIGRTENNEIMAIRHQILNIRGLQFHPEAVLTEYGKRILQNWVRENQL
jgi:anthranilate synthase component 2